MKIAGHAPSRSASLRPWVVCLGCGLSLFTVMGLGVNVFTVYQPHLLLVHGFTNAQGSWITTVRSLFALLSMLTVDQLCRSWDCGTPWSWGWAASWALISSSASPTASPPTAAGRSCPVWPMATGG